MLPKLDAVTKKIFEALVEDEDRHFDQFEKKWKTSRNTATTTWPPINRTCKSISSEKLPNNNN
jgi:rubrerythrin